MASRGVATDTCAGAEGARPAAERAAAARKAGAKRQTRAMTPPTKGAARVGNLDIGRGTQVDRAMQGGRRRRDAATASAYTVGADLGRVVIMHGHAGHEASPTVK